MTNEDQPPPVNVTPHVIEGVRHCVRLFIRECGRTPTNDEANAMMSVVQNAVFATMVFPGARIVSIDIEHDDAGGVFLVVALDNDRRLRFAATFAPGAGDTLH